MTDIEKTLAYFEKHENRLRKEIHRFLWKNARNHYEIDLYFYPDTNTFYEFTNIGGNSWLNDNHVSIYSYNGEFMDIEKGRFREFVNGMTDIAVNDIFSRLKEGV